MKYKEKQKEVDMFQFSATKYDRLCEWLGYTPEPINNPVFDIDEYGDSRDSILGVWIMCNPKDDTSGTFRCYLGDCIVRHGNGRYEGMDPWDFRDKYEKIRISDD